MKALTLTAASTFTYGDVPIPKPGPDEVLIRIAACGICGSDIHGMDGRSGRRKPPIIMGHEAAGTIEAVGGNVQTWSPGQRVTFDSTVFCGDCRYCQEGKVNLCDSRQVMGVSCDEFHRNGAFAEYVTAPARILHLLPENLPFEEAAFAEPVGVALHAVSRAKVDSSTKALVVGTGLIGLLIVQALKMKGCQEIHAIDIDQSRLDLAQKLGATHSHLASSESAKALTGLDLALEVVGATPTLHQAIDAVRKGGQIVLVGNISPSVELPLQKIVTRELDVLGSCAIAGEYPAALKAIASGQIDVRSLITTTAPLSDGAKYFTQKDQLKVILNP